MNDETPNISYGVKDHFVEGMLLAPKKKRGRKTPTVSVFRWRLTLRIPVGVIYSLLSFKQKSKMFVQNGNFITSKDRYCSDILTRWAAVGWALTGETSLTRAPDTDVAFAMTNRCSTNISRLAVKLCSRLLKYRISKESFPNANSAFQRSVWIAFSVFLFHRMQTENVVDNISSVLYRFTVIRTRNESNKCQKKMNLRTMTIDSWRSVWCGV